MSPEPPDVLRDQRDGQMPLDYAHHRTVIGDRFRLPYGVLALGACVFQGLWLVFCVYGALAGYFGHGPEAPFVGVRGRIFVWWPTPIAFGLGCYSMYAERKVGRRIPGLLALILSGTLLALWLTSSCSA